MTICPTAEEFLTNQFLPHYCNWPVYWLIIISVVIGHCYPIFASFIGGKAAACTYSSAFFSSWFVGLGALSGFVITLKLKKYVSLSSISCALMLPIIALIFTIINLNSSLM
jgi:glycerol-3-phosphate acyltransferase PlsY